MGLSASAGALLLAASLGCAPSTESLRRHLDAGAHAEAAAEAAGNPVLQRELAALLLERATVDRERAAGAIRTLASGGAAGRRALSRIAEGEGPSAALSRIVSRRGAPPRGDELEQFLSDPSSDVRAAAADRWSGRAGADRLEGLLLDVDPRVRRAAVEALAGGRGGDREAGLLREALSRDPDPKVRSAAARAGPALGEGALGALVEALGDRSMGVRLAAVRGLSEIGSEDALAVLADLAPAALDEVATVAAVELARLGDAGGRARLEDALAHRRPGIRATALLHLERVGVGDADDIRARMLEDEAPRVVLLAAAALRGREERGPEVAAALRGIADRGGERSEEARDMLAALGEPEAVGEVRALFEGGTEAEIIASLARVRRAEALAGDFAALLGHESAEVRLAAAAAVLASCGT